MCNDNWTVSSTNLNEASNVSLLVDPLTEVIPGGIPATTVTPVALSIVPVNSQVSALTTQSNFQRLFADRDFSRMHVPQFVVRMQRFDFRRQSLEFMAPLYDQWLNRQLSHNMLLHQDEECDVCGTHVNDLALVASREYRTLMIPVQTEITHFLKHVSCGHTICSTCLVAKRFIFVNLGLPICCSLCGTCWLQF